MTTTDRTPAPTDAPDLGTYRSVHTALRQAAHRLADAAPDLTRATAATRRAYARYWKGYAGEVLVHHTVEDDHFFPALVERVPMAAELIERTDADHHHLDQLMDAIDASVTRVAAGQAAPDLVSLTAELAAHMDEHLDFEDRDILPLFERHFDGPTYAEIDARAIKSVGVGRQAMFTVPFVMAALTPDQAATTLASAPTPLRIVYRLTRRSHARLARRAFGPDAAGVA